MERIAITGAGGFLGLRLSADLAADGQAVNVLAHRPRRDLQNRPNINVVSGDLREPESLEQFIPERGLLVNLAYVWNDRETNLKMLSNLIDVALQKNVRRFIHVSSASVFGEARETVVTEETPCRPVREYGMVKLELERLIRKRLAGRIPFVIVRPTAIFGPGDPRSVERLAGLDQGPGSLAILKSCLMGRRRMNLVGVENVSAAISFLLESDIIGPGEVFIVSDDEFESNNYWDVQERVLKGLGRPSRPRVLAPPFLFPLIYRVVKRGRRDPAKVYSCQKLLGLGFIKPQSFDDALSEFINWVSNRAPSEHAPDKCAS